MRVKRGKVKSQKHKKTLKSAKGYRLTYSKLYRRAKEALLHAGEYNYKHRRKRPSQFKKYWIKSINAVCKQNSTTYSKFMHSLKQAGVKLDRKILSYLAYNHKFALNKLIEDTK